MLDYPHYDVAKRIQEAVDAELSKTELVTTTTLIWPQDIRDKASAEEVLQSTKAALVIWGEYDAGRVHAANVDGGAEFEILLPEVRAEGEPAAPARTEGPFPTGRESVLLVEDDPALLALGREVLTELGYQVHVAASGLEALRWFEQQGPAIDILVTDVVMPGMGGRELAERILASRPRLPVLYVSGYHRDELLRESQTARGVSFLEKPYTAMMLARRVRETLDLRRTIAAP